MDFDTFITFCKTVIGREIEPVGGKAKFALQNMTDRAFYYQVSGDERIKQHIRYVQRVLEQYAKIKSFNPGHYANITPNSVYILSLIQLYETNASRKPQA